MDEDAGGGTGVQLCSCSGEDVAVLVQCHADSDFRRRQDSSVVREEAAQQYVDTAVPALVDTLRLHEVIVWAQDHLE